MILNIKDFEDVEIETNPDWYDAVFCGYYKKVNLYTSDYTLVSYIKEKNDDYYINLQNNLYKFIITECTQMRYSNFYEIEFKISGVMYYVISKEEHKKIEREEQLSKLLDDKNNNTKNGPYK